MNRYNYRYASFSKSSRLKPLLIILAAALVVFLIFKLASIGSINESNYEVQRDLKLRNEAKMAVTTVNTLSRLGASSSSGTLGKIRQYVHAIEVINDLNVSMYGEVGRLYSAGMFSSIYDIIDEYDSLLITGQKVNEVLTSLSAALNNLNDQTLRLIAEHQKN